MIRIIPSHPEKPIPAQQQFNNADIEFPWQLSEFRRCCLFWIQIAATVRHRQQKL